MKPNIPRSKVNIPLKLAIVQTGQRQYDIAVAAKIQVTRLSAVVNGYQKLRDAEEERLAAVLGVDVDEIFPTEH
ncbi:MAG: helix-turn-helix transcriptional regulator [Phycisphaerae bacterium]|nr:helix-turn-helix transcriptional regulator [Phycisphaerae bacterium]